MRNPILFPRPKLGAAAVGLAAAASLLSGCMVNLDVGVGDGVTVTEVRDLNAFSRIRVNGNMHVTVIDGGSYSARVTTDDNLTDACRTSIRNGILEVDWAYDVSPSADAEVVITSPYLTSFANNGDGDVSFEATGLLSDLRLELNGSGDLFFRGHADRLTAVVNGDGILEMEGSASTLKAQVNGSGALYADPLAAADIQAVMAGSGDMTLALDGGAWLDLTVTGSGQTEWWGNPGRLTYHLIGNGAVVEHRGLYKKGAQTRLPRHGNKTAQ